MCAEVLCWAGATGPRHGEAPFSQHLLSCFYQLPQRALVKSSWVLAGWETNKHIFRIYGAVEEGERRGFRVCVLAQPLCVGRAVCGWGGVRKFLSQVCFPGQLWKVSQANSFIPSHCISISVCTGGDVRYTSSKWLRRRKLSGSHKLKRVMGEFVGSQLLIHLAALA